MKQHQSRARETEKPVCSRLDDQSWFKRFATYQHRSKLTLMSNGNTSALLWACRLTGNVLIHRKKTPLKNIHTPILKNYHYGNINFKLTSHLLGSIFLLNMWYCSIYSMSTTRLIFSAAGSTDKALIFALHGFYQPTVRLKESLFFPPQSKTVKEIL